MYFPQAHPPISATSYHPPASERLACNAKYQDVHSGVIYGMDHLEGRVSWGVACVCVCEWWWWWRWCVCVWGGGGGVEMYGMYVRCEGGEGGGTACEYCTNSANL